MKSSLCIRVGPNPRTLSAGSAVAIGRLSPIDGPTLLRGQAKRPRPEIASRWPKTALGQRLRGAAKFSRAPWRRREFRAPNDRGY